MEILFMLAITLVIGHMLSRKQKAERTQRVRDAYNFNPQNAHGGSRFATYADLLKAKLLGRKGIFIGFAPDGWHKLFYAGAGHILTVAAARSGKGLTLLINALLSWRHSCIIIDPKAELAAVTAHGRRRFGAVYILNPFSILSTSLEGVQQVRFNPMDLIDVTSTAFHAMCDKLASALVWEEGREGLHFTTAARALVSGVIAALIRHGVPAERNLATVARIIGGDIFGFCTATVQASNDPFIAQKLSRFAARGADQSREVQDVVSTATTQLAFIGNEAIANSLSGSDFRFSDLKRKSTTIYICLPLNMLDVCDKYFRLILDTALSDLLDAGRQGKGVPVLTMVDEMAQLGPHMKSLENAMGMASGAAGIQLWSVIQDLSQLKGMFPQTWETFIQNCGVTTWFAARDETTREYVSRLSGTTEILSRSRSVNVDPVTGEPHVSDSANQTPRPLILPHEVGQLAKGEMICFVDEVKCGPIKAKRKPYFRVFRSGYRRNPYV